MAEAAVSHLPPAEARPTTTTLTWRGVDLVLPASLDDCSIDVLEAFEAGKTVSAARAIIGAEQYAALKAEMRLTVRDVGDLTDHIARAMGLGSAGE